MMLPIDRESYTMVFAGDVSKLPFNPMAAHKTIFGRALASGFGNAFDREEILIEALESIAANTCCEGCQEAALVARTALEKANV